LAGACVKAALEFFGKETTEVALYNKVLCMEQLMSTGGGWQDQVGGLVPGIKLISSGAAIKQQIKSTPLNISEETYRRMDERFCLIYTGQRRLARNLLRDIVGNYLEGRRDTVYVLDEIKRVAQRMKDALEAGDIDLFAKILNEHWELSKRLDAGSTNSCIDQILLSIEDMLDGRMMCGAGGGGFLQVILKSGVTREMLSHRLGEIFGDCGVDVWKCRITREDDWSETVKENRQKV
jgi:fucokinase